MRSISYYVKVVLVLLMVASGVWYFVCLPGRLFQDPYSTVLEDKSGTLLTATIASDGQWRFPLIDSVPEKYTAALIAFEDKRFMQHPGVDLLALGRAMQQNLSANGVVSGGSTISMQVIRLSRKNRPRTYTEKLVEIILATRLELRYTKKEILQLYASHAPFGGNVVGLEAACWRYFGRGPQHISWGEAALLAVLPNAPSLIHPGRNREALMKRRNNLLDRLRDTGIIDALTCALSKEETIPDEPTSLPRHARHLLLRAGRDDFSQTRVRTSVDINLQVQAEQIIEQHLQQLHGNQIHNAAALVLDTRTGSVLAYVGNGLPGTKAHHAEVDVIAAERSTGSILKPFLYAAMLEEGKMLPRTLWPDAPVMINGFAPRNFSHEFDGAVPADAALIRSLNIPAVHMLQEYRYEKFHNLLRSLGMSTLHKLPDHYGLALVLGGAEGTLWDITGMYASLGRIMESYGTNQNKQSLNQVTMFPPSYLPDAGSKRGSKSPLGVSSIYQTLDVLKEVYRPGEETGWRNFQSTRRVAWKTGTSFGFRDGWAVGVTPEFTVGVWVGNADGEGRPGLTGTETAAPVMFDIFSMLPASTWFREPLLEMEQIPVCKESGMRISAFCNQQDTIWISPKGLESIPCSYHKRVYLTADNKYRVTRECYDVKNMVVANWFVLPPVAEHYYRKKSVSYRSLPQFLPGCGVHGNVAAMDLIYPKPNARLYINRQLDGTAGNSVFELAHRSEHTHVYWHLDGEYLGTTRKSHRMPVFAASGKHRLVIIDDTGNALERDFEVISN